MKRREFMSQSASLGVVMAAGAVPNVFAGNFFAAGAGSILPAPVCCLLLLVFRDSRIDVLRPGRDTTFQVDEPA